MKNYTNEQKERIMQFINMADEDFYDEYVSCMPLEEQAKFFEEFPEFMQAAGQNEQINEQIRGLGEKVIEDFTRKSFIGYVYQI